MPFFFSTFVASVPHLQALLTEPKGRPEVFDLKDAGEVYRFDPQSVGMTVPAPSAAQYRRLMSRAKRDDREVYDTLRIGQSNRGHEFGLHLDPHQKQDLIEYLKSL